MTDCIVNDILMFAYVSVAQLMKSIIWPLQLLHRITCTIQSKQSRQTQLEQSTCWV
jgi:hypothetical protein